MDFHDQRLEKPHIFKREGAVIIDSPFLKGGVGGFGHGFFRRRGEGQREAGLNDWLKVK